MSWQLRKYLIQENSSWAQRLTNLLSWYVAELVHGFDSFRLNLLQLSVASTCHARGSSRQDMGRGQADNRYPDTAK